METQRHAALSASTSPRRAFPLPPGLEHPAIARNGWLPQTDRLRHVAHASALLTC